MPPRMPPQVSTGIAPLVNSRKVPSRVMGKPTEMKRAARTRGMAIRAASSGEVWKGMTRSSMPMSRKSTALRISSSRVQKLVR